MTHWSACASSRTHILFANILFLICSLSDRSWILWYLYDIAPFSKYVDVLLKYFLRLASHGWWVMKMHKLNKSEVTMLSQYKIRQVCICRIFELYNSGYLNMCQLFDSWFGFQVPTGTSWTRKLTCIKNNPVGLLNSVWFMITYTVRTPYCYCSNLSAV